MSVLSFPLSVCVLTTCCNCVGTKTESRSKTLQQPIRKKAADVSAVTTDNSLEVNSSRGSGTRVRYSITVTEVF